ncbi:MAG: 16S rRNA (uracil(1498)-N(3))-methyltransferase [Pleurocapsa sp.]
MVYRLAIAPSQIHQDRIDLTPQQQHYLLRVLRLKTGDRFIAMDGQGRAWIAQIEAVGASIVEEIAVDTELPVAVTLITALPKGSGYEQVIRCCTELGVTTFLPVRSDRTIIKPSDNKVQRWRKIATEAAEQSERQIVPAILNPISFTEAIAQTETAADKYICVARHQVFSLAQCLRQKPAKDLVIATGCEGGWTDNEVERAIAAGYQPVTLGRRILRAVTAPIVASSLVASTLEGNF